MAYLTKDQLELMGFKSIGSGVKISDKASIYNPELIEIGDRSRIDDFCVMSGKIRIGKFVHVTPMCLVAGGEKGIVISDFVALAYGAKVFSQSDDYSGETLTNSNILKKYKNEFKKEVIIGKHSIIGAGSIIMPGVVLAEGTAVGAMSLIKKNTKAWSIYVGCPARKVKDRSQNLLELEEEFMRVNYQ